jgi:hypothetical protein
MFKFNFCYDHGFCYIMFVHGPMTMVLCIKTIYIVPDSKINLKVYNHRSRNKENLSKYFFFNDHDFYYRMCIHGPITMVLCIKTIYIVPDSKINLKVYNHHVQY